MKTAFPKHVQARKHADERAFAHTAKRAPKAAAFALAFALACSLCPAIAHADSAAAEAGSPTAAKTLTLDSAPAAATQSDAALATQSAAKFTKAQKKVLDELQGWWKSTYHHDIYGYQPVYGLLHGTTIDWYRYEPTTGKISYGNSVEITKVARFSENGKKGWKFFTFADYWAYYYANGKHKELSVWQTQYGYGKYDTAGYNIYSPERYGMTKYNSNKLNTLIKKTSISTVDAKNVRYTGKAVAPTVKLGHTTLKKGRDYTISYKTAKGKKISAKQVKKRGTYRAVITGKGHFTGKATKTFRVK